MPMPPKNPGSHDRRTATGQASPGPPAETEFDARWEGAVIKITEWHFHRRLLERYEIVLAPADYTQIARSIARRRAPLIESKPDGTGVYLVRVPSSGALLFVAARPNGEMITALKVTERLLALVRLAVT